MPTNRFRILAVGPLAASALAWASPLPADAGAPVTCAGHRATIIGTANADRLVGTKGPDVIAGLGGSDTIRGRGGHDVICGGRGNDRINPDAGKDGSDLLYGGTGNDGIWFGPTDQVHGGRGHDDLLGNFAPGRKQLIDGGRGHNQFQVGLHRPKDGSTWDHALIDLAAHRVVVDGKVVRFAGRFEYLEITKVSGVRAWTLDGTRADDRILAFNNSHAHPHPIIEHGRRGDDYLVTGVGDDTLDGGQGTDLGYANDGNDTCISIEGPAEDSSTTGCETSTR
jgi:Ca2+-binding RTX toxin-like protein